MTFQVTKDSMKRFLVFITILLPLLLIIMYIWYFINPINSPFELKKIITDTIYVFIAIILGWILFKYQEKRDVNLRDDKKNRMTDNLFGVINTASGIELKLEAVLLTIFSLALFIGGIYLLITKFFLWYVGAGMILVSILLIYPILTNWFLGKQRLKGKYY